MKRVVLDGETVEFEGEAPASCREACELVHNFLSGQGLSIDTVLLDGAVVTLEQALELSDYSVLELTSIHPLAQLLGMCRTWRQGIGERLEEMKGLSAFVLRNGWADSQAKAVAFLETLRPLVEGYGVLQGFGSESGATWAHRVEEDFQAGLAGIDGLANAVESRDCVGLSDAIAGDLSEGWDRMARCLEDAVMPALEKEVGQ